MSTSRILILVAVILFVLSAFGVTVVAGISTLAIGLAFFAAGHIVP